ncbi:MAG: DUF262 domain-containing protein [Prevotellaceae bacterium]|nr:DUF262 domain-containing protein [Prevotellaceae bacterium]
MEKTLPLEERSIYQMYLESLEPKTYMIPIYQRNYAWEEDEIQALVKDVHDSSIKSPNIPYYIGTLVTYKRGYNLYEVIDGQQRLTTIYIILKAMGIKEVCNKLTYGARKASASTIQKLDSYPDLGEDVDNGIRNGYKYAEKALNSIVGNSERKAFESYFLHNVHIIHYSVPKDVDLNHYFEVMNSRGEQLEKHEIVKSTLSQYLKDKIELATFCRIWEACSEMNVFIQQAFPCAEVFGYNLHKFRIESFEEIPEQDESQGKETILNLLKKPITKIEDSDLEEQNDKFQPIIDFPNFLLIVLKVTRMEYANFNPIAFTLDDKELLYEFKVAINAVDDQAEFARQFIFNLLKAKFLLDNYIVHHSLGDKEFFGDNPWKLQYYYRENTKKRYPKNLTSTQDVQKELVHLLSMFEVSFTPKQRKNYLFYCMMFLFSKYEPTDREYLGFLQCLADKYFYDVYLNPSYLNEKNQPGPNAFDNTMLNGFELNFDYLNEDVDYRVIFEDVYKTGSMDIPLFVFNYTDYILWKKYADELRGEKTKKGSKARTNFFEELGCSDFELDPFNNFYFSRTRKSLEHYYPQAKAGADKPICIEDINRFGNFAMISAEANSSGSNWDPKTKLDHYSDGKADQVSVASLKFKIMMQMCQDNHKAMLNGDLDRPKGMEWNVEDMLEHQEKMLSIII